MNILKQSQSFFQNIVDGNSITPYPGSNNSARSNQKFKIFTLALGAAAGMTISPGTHAGNSYLPAPMSPYTPVLAAAAINVAWSDNGHHEQSSAVKPDPNPLSIETGLKSVKEHINDMDHPLNPFDSFEIQTTIAAYVDSRIVKIYDKCILSHDILNSELGDQPVENIDINPKQLNAPSKFSFPVVEGLQKASLTCSTSDHQFSKTYSIEFKGLDHTDFQALKEKGESEQRYFDYMGVFICLLPFILLGGYAFPHYEYEIKSFIGDVGKDIGDAFKRKPANKQKPT